MLLHFTRCQALSVFSSRAAGHRAADPCRSGAAHGQPSGRKVIVYYDMGYRGRGEALAGDWRGGGNWDRRIGSAHVPAGVRVTLYSKPNFQETETRLLSDWSPSSNGAY